MAILLFVHLTRHSSTASEQLSCISLAGNRHARFDERGWVTERCCMAQATALSLPKTRFGRIDGGYTQCQSRHNEDELWFPARASRASVRQAALATPQRLLERILHRVRRNSKFCKSGHPGEHTLSTCISST